MGMRRTRLAHGSASNEAKRQRVAAAMYLMVLLKCNEEASGILVTTKVEDAVGVGSITKQEGASCENVSSSN